MPDTATEYRRFLDPRTLAKLGSLELRARAVIEGVMTGAHRSPLQGASVEFDQHRQYVVGDDIRHVDWKVYLRNEKIYLKQYVEETNLQLILVVDASESMGFGSIDVGGGQTWSKYDHATSIAASLAYMAIQQADSVGLAIFDQQVARYFKPSNSPTQWKLVVNEMQQVPRWNKTGIGRVLDQIADKLHHRSVIVLISDLFDDVESIQQGLRHLRYKKHDVLVMQVLDPQEIEFPFEDVTLFKGLESLGELLTEPRSLRDGYLEQLSRHTERIQRLCRGMSVDFSRFNVADPLDVTLSEFLARRATTMK
jgi:uncharacterized protein (DUF58 family)